MVRIFSYFIYFIISYALLAILILFLHIEDCQKIGYRTPVNTIFKIWDVSCADPIEFHDIKKLD